MFAQQSQKSKKCTAQLPFGSTKKHNVMIKYITYVYNLQGNPLPESCIGLFITLCTEWILKKRTRKLVFM